MLDTIKLITIKVAKPAIFLASGMLISNYNQSIAKELGVAFPEKFMVKRGYLRYLATNKDMDYMPSQFARK